MLDRSMHAEGRYGLARGEGAGQQLALAAQPFHDKAGFGGTQAGAAAVGARTRETERHDVQEREKRRNEQCGKLQQPGASCVPQPRGSRRHQ